VPLSRRGLIVVLAVIVLAAVGIAVVVNRTRIEGAVNTATAGGDETLTVPSEAMQPTLDVGDAVAVSTAEPFDLAVGDVVVTGIPGPSESKATFKRIIAIGPAEVVMADGEVLVNGTTIEEAYLTPGTVTEPSPRGVLTCAPAAPCQVPAGSFWGMGDNRRTSMDSRTFGPIPLDEVEGVVLAILSPSDRAGPIAGSTR
jgi:signal peptidase I